MKQYWIFTFGCGQKYAGKAVKISGTFNEARRKMFEKYGEEWCWQYSEKEWETYINDPYRIYDVEEIMEIM